MCAKRKKRLLLQSWLALLFRQPPQGFYHAPAVYLSGGRMEVEHFCRILAYSPDRLCLQMPHGRLTIYGDAEDRHPYRQPPDPAGAVRAHGLCG